jgi:hypothetical protein
MQNWIPLHLNRKHPAKVPMTGALSLRLTSTTPAASMYAKICWQSARVPRSRQSSKRRQYVEESARRDTTAGSGVNRVHARCGWLMQSQSVCSLTSRQCTYQVACWRCQVGPALSRCHSDGLNKRTLTEPLDRIQKSAQVPGDKYDMSGAHQRRRHAGRLARSHTVVVLLLVSLGGCMSSMAAL